LSWTELSAYAGLGDRFESVVGWVTAGVVVGAATASAADVGVLSARALFVTPNYFRTLGARLAAGRGFTQSRFEERFRPSSPPSSVRRSRPSDSAARPRPSGGR
jgi:hypothetical protein